MRYIDSGSRQADQALGTWLNEQAAQSIQQFRMQSGYFSLDGLGPLEQALRDMSAAGGLARIVVGSNEGATLGLHVERLADILAMPRTGAEIGVVSFANSIFHPKTLHFHRADGSQAAYVGSANMGRSAVSGLNVEAGMILDEHDGDPVQVIAAIADAVDAWFTPLRSGLNLVTAATDVPPLVTAGILALVPIPKVNAATGGGGAGPAKPSLSPLVQLPTISSPTAIVPTPAVVPAPALPSATLPGYPSNMHFASPATGPTNGLSGLSGIPLPGGAAGVVLRLSKDTCRFWLGNGGTANITVPRDALDPLRFGFSGSGKPRAEFEFESRRIHAGGTDVIPAADTNVMAYGYGPSPTGHKDLRLLFPRAVSDGLASAAAARGAATPAPGDYAMLEWPTAARPTFRFSIADPSSAVYGNMLALVAAATTAGTLVGPGGCWLPAGVSPSW